MAQNLAISRRSISKIEKGEQNLSLDMAYRISAYFQLLVQDVFPMMNNCSFVTMPEQESGKITCDYYIDDKAIAPAQAM